MARKVNFRSRLLHLLLSLPSAWSEGEVSGLRARGGFTVNIRGLRGGVAEAAIQPGRAETVRIRYREQIRNLTMRVGEALTIGPVFSGGSLPVKRPERRRDCDDLEKEIGDRPFGRSPRTNKSSATP